ncbi:hypothetical protein D3C80_1233840 [compost metagenome]
MKTKYIFRCRENCFYPNSMLSWITTAEYDAEDDGTTLILASEFGGNCILTKDSRQWFFDHFIVTKKGA